MGPGSECCNPDCFCGGLAHPGPRPLKACPVPHRFGNPTPATPRLAALSTHYMARIALGTSPLLASQRPQRRLGKKECEVDAFISYGY